MIKPCIYVVFESWVDLHYKNSSSENSSNGQGSPKTETSIEQSGLYTPLNIEKLLQDAQRESGQNSRETSARTSPKGLRSPIELTTQEENVLGTDWMWDWSSGPEKNQSREQAFRLRNAAKKRPGYTLRNTSVMKNPLFCRENLTALVASHVSVFVLGAVVMYMILKKTGHQVVSQS
ncbi:BCL2/adenovirus E1B 19 kDa protein-interacting protein 3-like isoform X2 [Mercenaria mercenaria]|uniref:BCL2/adenovirus E1B 19 kDa protein-interacting protein 3-like isoform X2 n=1 Tax=Mercenaria mercenaria TaxID=6596 RepID=UPI00234E89E4|nr:BCL2/adenovirus E1B 19 kDa protein-interacting protein 3-like isoform X2 [Mercenaria mercenaria]